METLQTLNEEISVVKPKRKQMSLMEKGRIWLLEGEIKKEKRKPRAKKIKVKKVSERWKKKVQVSCLKQRANPFNIMKNISECDAMDKEIWVASGKRGRETIKRSKIKIDYSNNGRPMKKIQKRINTFAGVITEQEMDEL